MSNFLKRGDELRSSRPRRQRPKKRRHSLISGGQADIREFLESWRHGNPGAGQLAYSLAEASAPDIDHIDAIPAELQPNALAWNRLSNSSRQSYLRAFAFYANWCAEQGECWAEGEELLLQYLMEEKRRTMGISSLTIAHSALKWLGSRMANPPTDTGMIKDWIEWVRKCKPGKDTRPIVGPAFLSDWFRSWKSRKTDLALVELHSLAMFTLQFWSASRIQHMAKLRWSDIRWSADRQTISLFMPFDKTKKSPLQRGALAWRHIRNPKDSIGFDVTRLLDEIEEQATHESPYIWVIPKKGQTAAAPCSPQAWTARLKRYAGRLGYETAPFLSTHSVRRGAVTYAIHCGVPREEIRALARWSTTSSMDSYYDHYNSYAGVIAGARMADAVDRSGNESSLRAARATIALMMFGKKPALGNSYADVAPTATAPLAGQERKTRVRKRRA